MVFSAYLLENTIFNWCCPRVGNLHYIFEPHRGAFAAFPKQNDKCPGEGGIDGAIMKKKGCSRGNSVLQFLQIKLEGICLALAGTFLQKQL